MTLRSVDVDDPQDRERMLDLMRCASASPSGGMVSRDRCRPMLDAVLTYIRRHGEDLDAILAHLDERTREVEHDTALSLGRVAAFEQALGIGPEVIDQAPRCATRDCPGDPRYAPPGRGHLSTCRWPAAGVTNRPMRVTRTIGR